MDNHSTSLKIEFWISLIFQIRWLPKKTYLVCSPNHSPNHDMLPAFLGIWAWRSHWKPPAKLFVDTTSHVRMIFWQLNLAISTVKSSVHQQWNKNVSSEYAMVCFDWFPSVESVDIEKLCGWQETIASTSWPQPEQPTAVLRARLRGWLRSPKMGPQLSLMAFCIGVNLQVAPCHLSKPFHTFPRQTRKPNKLHFCYRTWPVCSWVLRWILLVPCSTQILDIPRPSKYLEKWGNKNPLWLETFSKFEG